MAVREEIVTSAVTFLQDPDVAASPIEKRIAFLQSKKLTSEEIETALARASGAISSPNYSRYPSSQYAIQQPQPMYGQPPPLKRDWKDLFIMATVMGGVGYGLYTIVKRYIYPIIAPPTVPQLEQDKQAISESFDTAFLLLDQLANDTEQLKLSEQARTDKLDTVLKEVDTMSDDVINSSRRREEETRRITVEINGLKKLIPIALEGHKESVDSRLKELNSELRSLKLLLGQRINSGTLASPSLKGQAHNVGTSYPITTSAVATEEVLTNDASNEAEDGKSKVTSITSTSLASLPASASTGPVFLGKTAAIPSWQLAANRNMTSANSSGSQGTSSAK